MKYSPFSTIRSQSSLTNILVLAIVCSTLYLFGAALLQFSIWKVFLGVLLISLAALGQRIVFRHRQRAYAATLASLSETQLATLSVCGERCLFPKYKVLFRQDARADRLYLVVRGEVEVLRRGSDDIYTPTALVGAGSWLGEIESFGRTTRKVAAKATTEVEVLVIDRADFAAVLAATPTAAPEQPSHHPIAGTLLAEYR